MWFRKHFFLASLIALVVIATGVVSAQSSGFDLTWSVISSNGAQFQGNNYTLEGSIGQPVIGQIENGNLRITGGFWNRRVTDTASPAVLSSTLVGLNPSNAISVDFTVTFSEEVTSVDPADFVLTKTGAISGEAVINVRGAGAIYTVTVSTGTGNGTLRLDVLNTADITDMAGNFINNLPYNDGEIFFIVKTAPVLLAPENLETLHSLRPLFDWSDYSGARGYQIQVSKKITFSTTILNVSLTGATNSQYAPTKDLTANTLLYWRVRAKLSATKYSAWSTVYTFTTGNPPSVPTLVSPANGLLLTNLSPTLDWSDSTVSTGVTLDHYQLQMDDNEDFSSPILDTSVGASSMTVGPLNTNTKYYWRVRAWGTNGHYSGWSLVRNFREAILAPTLLSPVGGMTVPSLKPLFDWSDVVGATGYTIQVSLSSTFNTYAINVTLKTATSQYTHSINLQSRKLYYWRVRANGPNGPSIWSAVETFRTP